VEYGEATAAGKGAAAPVRGLAYFSEKTMRTGLWRRSRIVETTVFEPPFKKKRTTKGAKMDQIWTARALSVLRIMTALLFMEHGTAKLFGFPPAPPSPPHELFSLIGMSGPIEAIGGLLLALGLFTRPVAFILCGEMAVAYFMRHAPNGFFPLLNRGDSAIQYCFVFLYLIFAGAGPWSLDAIWCKKAK
jgi:putative oxidoreductase